MNLTDSHPESQGPGSTPYSICAVALLLVLCGTWHIRSTSRAQERGAESAGSSTDAGGLVATARPVPEGVVPGLPLSLLVDLRNSGTEKVTVHTGLNTQTGRVEIVVERPDGRRTPVGEGESRDRMSFASEELAPGERLRLQEWVFDFRGQTDYFPEAGTYLIHVRVAPWKDRKRWLDAPPVVVEVGIPSEKQVEAALLVTENLRIHFLGIRERVWSTRHRSVWDQIERLAGVYPETEIGGFGAYLLAILEASLPSAMREHPGRFDALGRDPAGSLERATKLLENLRLRGAPPGLEWEVDRALVDLYLEQGKWREAGEAWNRLPVDELPYDWTDWLDAAKKRLDSTPPPRDARKRGDRE